MDLNMTVGCPDHPSMNALHLTGGWNVTVIGLHHSSFFPSGFNAPSGPQRLLSGYYFIATHIFFPTISVFSLEPGQV